MNRLICPGFLDAKSQKDLIEPDRDGWARSAVPVRIVWALLDKGMRYDDRRDSLAKRPHHPHVAPIVWVRWYRGAGKIRLRRQRVPLE
jgi:hypothetical protein